MSEARRGAHVAGEELALYVIDALDPERKDSVESHVLSCEECAEALEREARVEAAFEQVARLANDRAWAPVRRVPPAAAPRGFGATDGREASVQLALRAPRLDPRLDPARLDQGTGAIARLVAGGRRSRWAGGVAGALAAATVLVMAFASATARSEPSNVVGVAQRGPGLHDAAGDMSGAFGGEVVIGVATDSLDGG
jgi:hypothetical protein